MTEAPENFPALLKSIAAMLGIETVPVTDAFGRTDFAIDRDGMEKLRAAAVEHGFDDLVTGIDRMMAKGPNR